VTKIDKFLDMFKGPTGGYDAARVMFGIGGITAIFSPVGFQISALVKGQIWNALEFCTGMGIILSSFAAVGFGIRQKDKGVADAQATMSNTTLTENANA
jgi:hypothetical protein